MQNKVGFMSCAAHWKTDLGQSAMLKLTYTKRKAIAETVFLRHCVEKSWTLPPFHLKRITFEAAPQLGNRSRSATIPVNCNTQVPAKPTNHCFIGSLYTVLLHAAFWGGELNLIIFFITKISSFLKYFQIST